MANKAQSIQERRAKRRAQELRVKAKREAAAIVEEEDEIEEAEELDDEISSDEPPGETNDGSEEEGEPEPARKDWGDGDYPVAVSQSTFGVTSFDELDAARTAQEKAATVDLASTDLRNIVRNITGSEALDPLQKAAAVKKVGNDFGKRIQAILSYPEDDEETEEVEVKEKDMDVLIIESILAKEHRDSNILAEALDKAKLTTAARKKLSPEQFALPSKKKYPIQDAAHVRNALARAAAEINKGGPDAADAKAALPKIHAAAKRMGIGMKKKEHGGLIVEKDKNGDYRWIGWPSNNFIDTDGDIFAESAHKEYVEFLDKNADMMPAFMPWHTPEAVRQHPVDFATYENGFLVMSGKLEEGEAQVLLKEMAVRDLGMSHGVLVFSRDPADERVITKYRMYEVSDLPLDRAANMFTTLELAAKEAGMSMTKSEDKIAYLAGFVGQERAVKLVKEQTAVAQQALKDAGVESKDKQGDAPAATTQATTNPADDHVLELITKAIKEQVDPDGLNSYLEDLKKEVEEGREAKQKVALLETAVKELKGGQEEAIAERLTAPLKRVWMTKELSAENKSNNVVPEDDPLLAGPQGPEGEENWLSAATGTAPIQATP